MTKAIALEVEDYPTPADESASASPADMVFAFPSGVPGYPDAKSFQLFALGKEFGPYLGFRCLDAPQPVFVVVQPSAVTSDYLVEIDDVHQELLGLTRPEEALILLITTLNGPGRLPSGNLAAPLVLNLSNRLGYQVLQMDSGLDMRHKLGVPFHDPNRLL